MNTADFSYFKKIQTYAKKRWYNKILIDILISEYTRRTKEYYLDAIRAGCILVNGNKTIFNYIIKEHDILTLIIHCHEPAQPLILYKNHLFDNKTKFNEIENSSKNENKLDYSKIIEIISIESDYVVVSKPPGIVSHPNAHYHYYSLTKTLEPVIGLLSCVNRLDVPTSGIVLLTKGKRLHNLMKDRKIQKTYIALVNGFFEDQVVDKPILKVYGKKSVVDENGKQCITKFKRLEYKNSYSLIECIPLTGRNHQIRVHLQSIGYAIVNDRLYNGETKEKQFLICKDKCTGESDKNKIDESLLGNYELTREAKVFAIENCQYQNSDAYKNKDSYICLHAYKYQIDDKLYTSKLPAWAKLD